jgi:hypothetical protein
MQKNIGAIYKMIVSLLWEYDPEDLETVIEKIEELGEKQKKSPEKYAKIICGPYFFNGESKGLTICQAENDVQLFNLHFYFQPELDIQFIPLLEREELKKLLQNE